MKHHDIKRGLDCLLAAGGILCLLPVFGGAILLCAASGEGIFYRQKRIGQGGMPFIVYKFRTMRREAPILPREQLDRPERYYIPGGAFLRSTGIDELPQLFNVLKGEMSLIGPRPLLPAEEAVHRLRVRRLSAPSGDHGACSALRRPATSGEGGTGSALSGKRIGLAGRRHSAGHPRTDLEKTGAKGKKYQGVRRQKAMKLSQKDLLFSGKYSMIKGER